MGISWPFNTVQVDLTVVVLSSFRSTLKGPHRIGRRGFFGTLIAENGLFYIKLWEVSGVGWEWGACVQSPLRETSGRRSLDELGSLVYQEAWHIPGQDLPVPVVTFKTPGSAVTSRTLPESVEMWQVPQQPPGRNPKVCFPRVSSSACLGRGIGASLSLHMFC